MRSLLALLAAVSICSGSTALAAADQPNILVIVADDLGYADIGVHGGKAVPTPNRNLLLGNAGGSW